MIIFPPLSRAAFVTVNGTVRVPSGFGGLGIGEGVVLSLSQEGSVDPALRALALGEFRIGFVFHVGNLGMGDRFPFDLEENLPASGLAFPDSSNRHHSPAGLDGDILCRQGDRTFWSCL